MAKIESHCLDWIHHDQRSSKAEKYKVTADDLNSDAEVISGHQKILPPTIYRSLRKYAKECLGEWPWQQCKNQTTL